MQFITNGPDVPDSLLQAHEEGRVVFFCGAGISYPAGLPGFKGLVDNIYAQLGVTKSAVEEEAYSRQQYDAALDLLERRVAGHRIAVRKAVVKSLEPKIRRQGAMDSHIALLHLARSRDGFIKLVTTNFDNVFDKAGKKSKQKFSTFSAPFLPIPKASRWDGIVYLHGKLPDKIDDQTALNRLVLTSGDFGLAYLTERWAARFVSNLFSNYVVCFLGYSINDPVLRYMMDALAADRMLGEVTPQAYAFADYEQGQEQAKTNEWEAKGVTPILYYVDPTTHDHKFLHQTIKTWSAVYRDGILGKEKIVSSHALAHPTSSSQQDDFVGRVCWALSDKSGLPAKRFAYYNPAPPISWLDSFSEERYSASDLPRFDVYPSPQAKGIYKFSLVHRPSPIDKSGWMGLTAASINMNKWDKIMFNLAHWLTRHLNDPKLLLWLVERGGELNESLKLLIENKLDTYAKLESENNIEEIKTLKINSPNAIPSKYMKLLWDLLLTGRIKSNWRNSDIYQWKKKFLRDGLTTTLRIELRELIAPKLQIRKAYHWDDSSNKDETAKRLSHFVNWDLKLAANNVFTSTRDLKGSKWEESLIELNNDFELLLLDALGILNQLGEANTKYDHSHWQLPSISEHRQNRHFQEWVLLIEWARDSWDAINKRDTLKASQIASAWFEIPYPTFKRLAFYAARQTTSITPNIWVEWLTRNESWWLWSVSTKREVMRLIVIQGATLNPIDGTTLELSILSGPPRLMFKDSLTPERWKNLVDRDIWLTLSKLVASGYKLGETANERLMTLNFVNPTWELAENERDEFSHWMSGTGDPDFKAEVEINIAPPKRKQLAYWLRKNPSEGAYNNEDTWRYTCRRNMLNSLYALKDLADEGEWLIERWNEALSVWTDKRLVARAWQYVAPIINTAPSNVLCDIAGSLAFLLEGAAQFSNRYQAILLQLCDRILLIEHKDAIENDQPVTKAINHPIGIVTRALLELWFKQKPNDNDEIPLNIRSLFSKICDNNVEQFRHGRVILASQLISLYRVDRAWTSTNLLPFFDWNNDVLEAKDVWEGFLWSPRLYSPLLVQLRPHLLETARHYNELGAHGNQYSIFLTYLALEPADTYTAVDFQAAFLALPQSGLNESANALVQALESTGAQKDEYWENRIKPFWNNIWPKDHNLLSDEICDSIASLTIASANAFPQAIETLLNWLQPFPHVDHVVNRLNESGLPKKYPKEVLTFLDKIIDNPEWIDQDLRQCLTDITNSIPGLLQDGRYQRLNEYCRRHEL
jgi:hypothetical protein